MSAGDFLEDEMMNHILGGPDYTRPATVFLALSLVDPLDSGLALTEPGSSTGTITTVAGGSLVDATTFVIDDGTTVVTYELDNNASVVETPTLRAVNFTGGDTADTVRDTIITAINNTPSFLINASIGGAGVVYLVNPVSGTAGNVAIVDTTAMTIVGMANGLDATGYTRVTVTNNATEWPASSGGAKSNGQEIAFPQATVDQGTMSYFALLDALTLGNLMVHDVLTTPKVIDSGDTPRWQAGTLTINLD